MSQESRDIDLDGEVQDTEDPDVFDGSEEVPEAMPEAEPLPENEPMMGGEEQVQPTGLENEFKTVPGVQAPEPAMEPESYMEPCRKYLLHSGREDVEDDGVLFGDAPDHRVKKTAYN